MSDQPPQGSEYEHEDGTIEVVFATAEGRVLTVREYPDNETFEEAISDTTSRGINDTVASMSVETFGEFGENE